MSTIQQQPVPSGFSLQRWPENDEELYWFIQAIWGVKIPRYNICPEHVPPFTAFANAYFARDPVAVWKASRGFGGKTNTLSCLVNTEAVCLAADSSILGGSAAQSLNVHASSTGMWHWHMAPRHLLRQEPTKYDTYLTNGAYIRSLMASQTSVRGPHPQRLRMDEIDEMEQSILDAALGQPMRKVKAGKEVETNTVLSSTHQYPDKAMTAMLTRAKDEEDWRIYEWCIARGSLITTKEGDVPIQCVRPHDLVLTRRGWKAVQHVTNMGIKPTIRLVLNNGTSLDCTSNHLISTPAGWVSADSALTVTTILADVPIVSAATGANVSAGTMSPSTLRVGSDTVVRLESAALQEVWDIGVEDEHEFVANGVVVHNCWRESANPVDGWLKIDEIERQKKIIPKAMWDAEYDLQEPSFEGRAFDPEAIESCFDPRQQTDSPIWWLPDYTINTRQAIYVTGIDWAKLQDWTVVLTFDAQHDPWHCIHIQIYHRIPWPAAVNRAERQYKKYGGPRGGIFAHDNTGLGNVIGDYLDEQCKQRRKYLPVTMGGGAARKDMFSEYISAIEGGKIAYPRQTQVYNEHKFCTLEDLYGKGHPPDSVVAGAIAWAARALLYGGAIPAPQGFSRESSPWDLASAQPT